MLIVADSSALVALAICDGLSLLDILFTQVRVPEAVWREVAVPEKPYAELLRRYLEGKVVQVDSACLRIETGYLGAGEREAIALFESLRANILLMDDSRARKTAQDLGIVVIGSLGVLLRGKEKGMLDQIKPQVEKLRRSSLFLADRLLDEVLRLAGE